MTKTFTLLLFCLFASFTQAQTQPVPIAQSFGKIDIADLEMKSCDFEKDANAEILFNKGDIYFDQQYNIISNIHKRIKIFNTNGKNEANIRIEYYSGGHSEYVAGLQAQTINLVNGAIEYTKVDKKQIFTEIIDKDHSALVFSFPNVKPGSVIEYKYNLTANDITNFPDWYFQSDIPTRYSELTTNIPSILYYKNLESIHRPYVVNKTSSSGAVTRALAYLPSVPDEPYMTSKQDNYERLLFQLLSISAGTFSQDFSDTWKKVGENVTNDERIGAQLSKKLAGEEALILKAKGLSNMDDKIAYLFSEVKNTMKWNYLYRKFSYDGTPKAWEKKTGNSGEINLILCRLLQKSGVDAHPMLTSTRSNGRVNPGYPNSYQFNNMIAYVPVDSTRFYVLDASNKFNIYNQVPANVLNSFGFYINKKKEIYDMVFLQNIRPVREVVQITSDIKPTGKMTGTAVLTKYGYPRVNAVEKYKKDGEKKYIEYLINNDNNLKISSVKFEDMEVDTLPLKQSVDFNLDLSGSDDNYIYFNPNILSSLKINPFLSENRASDIDFGYRGSYFIVGTYKIPAGYKVDALLKSVSMCMPDNSISFKRVAGESDGAVVVRYTLTYQKSIYFKEDYGEIHDFFKKMYEMLNEQVVLKKS
jgi:hypothetical protein